MLMKAQQKTWDSKFVDGVYTIYFYGGEKEDLITSAKHFRREFCTGTNDDESHINIKYKRVLELIKNIDFDFLFRTNSSSYINKELLIEKAKKLPKEKCYCGNENTINGISYASGCGYFISKDVASILAEKITEDKCKYEYDDVVIGEILSKNGIQVTKGAERFDFYATYNNKVEVPKTYHYRCKSDEKENRKKDILAFEKLFKLWV